MTQNAISTTAADALVLRSSSSARSSTLASRTPRGDRRRAVRRARRRTRLAPRPARHREERARACPRPGLRRELLRAAPHEVLDAGGALRALSLKALEQDRYARVVTGKLPEAQFAFVDEVFKANSAILNSLLAAMNERLFHNDGAPLAMPLVSLFGASNELPDGKELEALFDRFLLRFDVQYLRRPASFRAVVTGPSPPSARRTRSRRSSRHRPPQRAWS